VPSWYGILRQVSFVFATAIAYRPIRGATLIGIISIGGGGGWDRELHNRRWHGFDIGGILLVHLFLFFIGVAEDDDFVIIGQPEGPMVEVTEESLSEFCIPRGIRDGIFLIRRRRKINHQDLLRGFALLEDR
jgi:hypothetical protein